MVEATLLIIFMRVLVVALILVTLARRRLMKEALTSLGIVSMPLEPRRNCRSEIVPGPVALVIALASPAWGLGAPLMSTRQAP